MASGHSRSQSRGRNRASGSNAAQPPRASGSGANRPRNEQRRRPSQHASGHGAVAKRYSSTPRRPSSPGGIPARIVSRIDTDLLVNKQDGQIVAIQGVNKSEGGGPSDNIVAPYGPAAKTGALIVQTDDVGHVSAAAEAVKRQSKSGKVLALVVPVSDRLPSRHREGQGFDTHIERRTALPALGGGPPLANHVSIDDVESDGEGEPNAQDSRDVAQTGGHQTGQESAARQQREQDVPPQHAPQASWATPHHKEPWGADRADQRGRIPTLAEEAADGYDDCHLHEDMRTYYT